MSGHPLQELGIRLTRRIEEASISRDDLANLAQVGVESISSFERGEGGLAAGALIRLARSLGVPEPSFLHTEAPEIKAQRDPSYLLRTADDAAMLHERDQERLTQGLRRARSYRDLLTLLGVASLSDPYSPSPARATKPYRPGYDLSRSVRAAIENRAEPIADLRTLVEDRFGILVVEHDFDDPRVHAVACRSGAARLIAIHARGGSETFVRVSLAHELAHHLADLGPGSLIADQQESDGAFTLDPTPTEQRANAFAVMLLAPREGLAKLFGPPKRQFSAQDLASAVTEARLHFGVGFEAMTWHLFHLNYSDLAEDEVARISTEHDGREVSGFEPPRSGDALSRWVAKASASDAISARRAALLDGEESVRP